MYPPGSTRCSNRRTLATPSASVTCALIVTVSPECGATGEWLTASTNGAGLPSRLLFCLPGVGALDRQAPGMALSSDALVRLIDWSASSLGVGQGKPIV